MGIDFAFQWELDFMAWIQSWLGDFGSALMTFFSFFGEELILVLILGIFYWCYNKEYGVFIMTNFAFVLTITPLFKGIFMRRRPYFDHKEIQCLKPVNPKEDLFDPVAQGFSFPSAHSSNAVGAYGSLACKLKKAWLRIVLLFIPIAIGVSRFCLGNHYPTDVFAGWAIGAIITLLITLLQKKIKKRWLLYVALTICTIPGFFCRTDDFYTSFGIMFGFFSATLFEEKFVKFKNTRHVLRCILRLLIGIGLFLGINELLKLPFPSDFLTSGQYITFVIRSARYAISTFFVMGIYPMIFQHTSKFFEKRR